MPRVLWQKYVQVPACQGMIDARLPSRPCECSRTAIIHLQLASMCTEARSYRKFGLRFSTNA
jgi:hypothetical protein